MTSEDLFNNFISRLELIYGPYNKRRKSFKKTSNSNIARELCYSDSQFSRLINQSASDGEYERATKNAERILNEKSLEEKLQKLNKTNSADPALIKTTDNKWKITSIVFALLALVLIGINLSDGTNAVEAEVEKDVMLKWIFESSAISPFTKLDELPMNCEYPCYKYQGRWSLKESYKIPFYRERNGFHYLAKSVNLYTRCNGKENDLGECLEGYEYQNHEIWYDKRELQIDSFLVSTDNTQITDDYNKLIFENDPNFVKVAFVHTFFQNDFKIKANFLERNGQVIGRDIEFNSDEELLLALETKNRVEDIKNEVNSIISNRLEDFSRPVSCKDASLPSSNFHDINEKDEMSFDCQLTTANAPIKYTKTYIFDDQYIENVCRPQL